MADDQEHLRRLREALTALQIAVDELHLALPYLRNASEQAKHCQMRLEEVIDAITRLH